MIVAVAYAPGREGMALYVADGIRELGHTVLVEPLPPHLAEMEDAPCIGVRPLDTVSPDDLPTIEAVGARAATMVMAWQAVTSFDGSSAEFQP